MYKLPYFEDIARYYLHFSMRQLFPKKSKNIILVYIIGFFHLLGAVILQYGPFFLLPSFLPYYIFYVIVNLIGYYIFDDKCFMTLLSNYYGKLGDQPHRVRWSTFKKVLIFNLIISIFGYLFPIIAPINWFKLVTLSF